MMKKLSYILIFSLLALGAILFASVFDFRYDYKPVKGSYITLIPSLTEIVYSINAQDNLTAVTTACNYPPESLKKPKIGNSFFVNREIILKYKPEMIFAESYQKPFVEDLKKLGIKIYYYSYRNIDDINQSILEIGKNTNHSKEARKLVAGIKSNRNRFKTSRPKRILYLAGIDPIVSIGKDSYLTDAIQSTGHKSITANLNGDYPTISLEYIISAKPDLIIVSSYCNSEYIKKVLKPKIITLPADQLGYIEIPGPRIVNVLEYFSKI